MTAGESSQHLLQTDQQRQDACRNQDLGYEVEVDTTDGMVASGAVEAAGAVCDETALEAVAAVWLWFWTTVIGICDGRV